MFLTGINNFTKALLFADALSILSHQMTSKNSKRTQITYLLGVLHPFYHLTLLGAPISQNFNIIQHQTTSTLHNCKDLGVKINDNLNYYHDAIWRNVQSVDELLLIILEVTVYYFRDQRLLFRNFPVLLFPFKALSQYKQGSILQKDSATVAPSTRAFIST